MNKYIIPAVIALVVSGIVGAVVVGSVKSLPAPVVNQSNLAGLSERDVKAVSLQVGSPTPKFTVPSSGSSLSVGTSTPTTQGDVVIEGTATTTLVLSSSSSTKGSCIQMETVTGGVVRIVVTGTTISAAAGTCK
jgi:hypothetical protein